MKELRLMIVAAHPDEADMYAGGTAALLAEKGAKIKFLSLTNGDAGHFEIGGMQLARRRWHEAQEAAQHLGIDEYEVMNEHDGELYPSLWLRNQVIERVRRWAPDILIGFHADGFGHGDNRNAGRILAEAVPFLGLPAVLPTIPELRKKVLCLWMWDYGTYNLHRHDIAIDVTPTIEKKLLACHAHATQFLEFAPYERGFLDQVPTTWEGRREFILKYWSEFMFTQDNQRESLAKWYGADRVKDIAYAESFQIAPYGYQPTDAEIRRLFDL